MLLPAPWIIVGSMQTEPPAVTLRATESVSKLLQEITAQTGVHLAAEGKYGREILIVSVKNIGLDDLKKQIAWSMYARWQNAPGGPRLVEDPAATRAAMRHYVRWQSAEAATAIDRWRTRLLKGHVAPTRTPWEHHGPRLLPIDRAMAAALAQIKPDSTIFTDPDFVPTFADNPTPAQLPFADAGKSILEAFNAGIKNPVAEREAAHALLTCQYLYEVGTAELFLYDADGQPIDSLRIQFPLYDPAHPRPLELADRIPLDQKVPISQDSQFFVDRMGSHSSEQSAAEVAERMSHPELAEPLAGFVSDVWRAVADENHRNLLANVDDAYLDPSWAENPPSLRQAFRMAGGYNAEVSSNWLLARPSLPVPLWRHRMDRSALGDLLRVTRLGPIETFEAWSRFAAQCSFTPDAFTMMQILRWGPRFDQIDGWYGPRVYGCLPQTEKDLLAAGRSVPFNDLPDESKRALLALAIRRQGAPYSLESQPTVRFGAGLPANGSLKQLSNSYVEFSVRWRADGATTEVFAANVRQLAGILHDLSKKHADLLPNVGINEVVSRQDLLIADMSDPMRDFEIERLYSTADGRSYVWADAPDDVRQAVLAAAGD